MLATPPARIVPSVALALVLLAFPRPGHAHPEGLSVLTVSVEDRRVRVEMVLPAHVLPTLYPGSNPADAARLLEKDAADVLELRLNYAPVSPSAARVRADSVDSIALEMEFPATTPTGGPVTALQVYSNRLPKFGAGHRQLLAVHDARGMAGTDTLPVDAGRVVTRHALTAGELTAFVDLPAPGTGPTTVPDWQQVPGGPPPPDPARPGPPPLSFFHLGVEHILTGYDHLLFLAALLLVCRGFGEAARIVTCFTVAHSITLALAALDVVRLSPRIVEPLIAATIVYVAAENLIQSRSAGGDDRSHRRQVGWRMAVTFGFGLVHGLGFASALRESGVGSASRGLLAPLLQFNVGVEAGQLAVAAVVFPLLLAMRRRPAFHYERRWVPACSALVALAGAWWLVQRVAFA